MKTSPLDIYSSQSLIDEIINLAFEKKAKNLISLDLRGFSSLTDYFIICHGKSEPQVKAIVDNIKKKELVLNPGILRVMRIKNGYY